MSELIRVPDIGSGEGEVIELFVKVGDTVEADQSILTLESDKASMEIPSPAAGVVKAISVKLNDEVGTGDLILDLEVAGAAAPAAAAPAQAAAPAAAAPAPAAAPAAPVADSVQDIHVPDIGSAGKAKIIDVTPGRIESAIADGHIVILVHMRVDRVISDRPDDSRTINQDGSDTQRSELSSPAHQCAPGKGKAQEKLRPVGKALGEGIDGHENQR